MKTFFRYYAYRLKQGTLRTLIFSVLCIMIDLIGLNTALASTNPKHDQSALYMLATILCIVASVVPIFELSGLKSRRNLDTLYFFPIKREKMALVHYFSGFTQVAVIYTITFLMHYIYLAVQTDYFALVYMIPYYFLSLLLALIIYSVYVFVFVQANTVADGVVFCIFWIFVLHVVGYVVIDYMFALDLFGNNLPFSLAQWGILYTPMNNLTVLYQDLIEINRDPEMWDKSVNTIMRNFYMFYVWGGIGIAAAVGYVISFAKKGAEKAEEISNSWFGYKTMIPIYGYCLIFSLGIGQSVLWPVALIYGIAMIGGYIVYRRGFRFRISDIILTVAGAIPLALDYLIYVLEHQN